MAIPYDEDLAFVHDRGFGELAAAAVASLVPKLRARHAQRVIDVGCGAGVSTRALVEAGFETLAIEPSGALLQLARAAAPTARFEQGSAYEVALPPSDAILALGEVLTYHSPSGDADARLRDFFGRAHRALPEGGLLVFDLIEAGAPSLDTRAWTAGPDWAVLSWSREDVPERVLTREIETFRDIGGGLYRRHREVHDIRVFDRRAVSAWLEETGFDVETASHYGPYRLAPRRVAFQALRRAGEPAAS